MVIKSTKQRQGKLLQKLSDLNKVEFETYREGQLEFFATQFDNLLNNKPITNKSKIFSPTPIPIQLWYPNSCLESYSGWWQSAKIRHTILSQTLNYRSHLLPKLIILEKHQSNFLTGRDQTLAILREKVWITNAESLIKSVLC